MEKVHSNLQSRLTPSKEADLSPKHIQSTLPRDIPHSPQLRGKAEYLKTGNQRNVSSKASEAHSRPMDKQNAVDQSPNKKRGSAKKEPRDLGGKISNVKSPSGKPNRISRQPGVESLQVTVNGDKQSRSVQRPSAKKMERNYAKKMERGAKNSPSDGAEDVRRKRTDPKNVQMPQRDGRSGQGQEQGGAAFTSPHPGKGSNCSKKHNIERKPLGKLVNAKLREEDDAAKTTNGQNSPKKSNLQTEEGVEKPPGWKHQECPSPAVDRYRPGDFNFGDPWSETIERQEEELEKTYIFRLAKKSLKFPRALYYCRLCNYHIDTLPQCWVHIEQSRHNRLAKAKESENFFKNLPQPSPAHARALTKLLEEVTEENALTGRELNQRNEVRQRVENVLQNYLPECKVKMYGSSLNGFGFHDSDINLDIEVPNEKQASKILLAVSQGIADKVDKDFTNFEADFEGKHPCVRFKDISSGYRCEIGTGNQHSIQCSQLMVEYNECDGRLRPLVLGLRYWAWMCGIDQQAIGAMPAHTFVLLVIYFLQQCEPPVLPVLQQKSEPFKTKNKKSIGELWVDLLRFYLVGVNIEEIVISIRQREPVLRIDLKLPNRRIAIEDPFANGKKNVAKSLTTASVFQYIMDRFHDALKYFGIPENGLPQDSEPAGQASSDGSRTGSPGDVSNDTQHSGDIGDRLGKPLGGFEGDDDCDMAADIGAKLAEMVLSEVETEETGADATSGKDSSDSRTDPESISRTSETTFSASEKSDSAAGHDPLDTSRSLDKDTKNATESSDTTTSAFMNKLENTPRDSNNKSPRDDRVEDQEYVFTFNKQILTRGEIVQLICTSCLKEGHVSKDCPDDALPPLKPLPPMDPKFLDYGRMVCEEILLRNQPSPQDMRAREKCIGELEYYIRQHAFGDAQLSLFGSSGNGFGFRNSDLDICLTFHDRSTGQGVDVTFVIEKLAAALKRNHNLYNIVPIPTAKVPIIKFVHRPTRLEGDISLYNTLAQCNTRLLFMYSRIDERVRVLGYSMKFLAKHCDIGDASRGSLSSYAYTLLTIYFLQQRKPPVLPVLQELYTGDKQPVHEVDGWNAWFFDNLNQLPRVWKGQYKNKESIGSLWLGMLRFYTEEFDFTKYVVSIRQHRPLTRFEKLWMTPLRGIALEDPFDLEHNLGGAASKKMAIYIIQVLRNARDIFGTPRRIPREHVMNYFLNIEALSGGEPPPNDRGCRICGKIGHFVKDCPIKRRGMERKEQEKRDRERRERPSPNDTGTPGRGQLRDVKPTDSPGNRDERNRLSESKQRPGNTPSDNKQRPVGTPSEFKQRPANAPQESKQRLANTQSESKQRPGNASSELKQRPASVPSKAESQTVANSKDKSKPSSSAPKQEREKSKSGKSKERLVDDVARQLYPVKPIPIKKCEDEVNSEKDAKQKAPSVDKTVDKPTGIEDTGNVMMQHQEQIKQQKQKDQEQKQEQQRQPQHQQPPQHYQHHLPQEQQEMIQQRQNQQKLAALFQVMGKQSPLHGQAPTQSPMLRPPTTPTGAQTLDEIEQQLKSKQKQQQQQQMPSRLPPGAKAIDQVEKQFKNDQFFVDKDRSPGVPSELLQSGQLQHNQQQKGLPERRHGESRRGELSPQQLFPQHMLQQGQLPQSQKVIGCPPGLGFVNKEQETEIESQPQQQQQHRTGIQSQPIPIDPRQLTQQHQQKQQQQQQQRSANQSQPIPIDPSQRQHWQQQMNHPGWGSPSAFSPPSPFNRMASPPTHQHPGFPSHMRQPHPAASPPHNLLQSPPGASTPPAMAQYFGHNPFGPSVLPADFLESRQSPGGMAVSPPHHAHPQRQPPGAMSGWPQHPAASAVGWRKHHEQALQHGEPQMASAGSPRSPVESAGPLPSGVMPIEAQLQVQQAFGQSPTGNSAQPFHYSPLGLNPSLPRSSHTVQPSPHHPQHAQQLPQQPLPFQQHSDVMWQMQQQQQQQQRSNMQFTTTAAVGGPIMSVGQPSEHSRESSNSHLLSQQTMR